MVLLSRATKREMLKKSVIGRRTTQKSNSLTATRGLQRGNSRESLRVVVLLVDISARRNFEQIQNSYIAAEFVPF